MGDQAPQARQRGDAVGIPVEDQLGAANVHRVRAVAPRETQRADLPLARLGRLLDRRGVDVERVPLSYYRDRSFYTMRTDAYDRFGTRLEQRFTADQIRSMMAAAGLRDVVVSPGVPYWCAVGRRAG